MKNLKPPPIPPELWAGRGGQLSLVGAEMLSGVAAVSRPDICVRLARSAPRIHSLRRSHVYWINDLVRAVKEWQRGTALNYASSSRLCKSLRGGGKPKDELRKCGEKVGWSDAAYGDRPTGGECRMGYVVGSMSWTLTGPCHILQWTSKFTWKLAKSSPGGEVYALSATADYVSVLSFVFWGRSMACAREWCDRRVARAPSPI